MKKLLTIIFILCFVKTHAQTANAGADQTIYLTQTSSVTLMAVAVQEVPIYGAKIYDVQPRQAGYPTDPATITSPTSATTTVTGLIQGIWYYQIAVTTGATTKRDTVVVSVDYDVPPAGATLLYSPNFKSIWHKL